MSVSELNFDKPYIVAVSYISYSIGGPRVYRCADCFVTLDAANKAIEKYKTANAFDMRRSAHERKIWLYTPEGEVIDVYSTRTPRNRRKSTSTAT